MVSGTKQADFTSRKRLDSSSFFMYYDSVVLCL